MSARRVTMQEVIASRREAEKFVGRDEHLGAFRENLALPGRDRRFFLLSVHGDGGVGKSFLLRRLQEIASDGAAVHAFSNHDDGDVVEVLRTFVRQFEDQGTPLKTLKKELATYDRRRHEVTTDPQAPSEGVGLVTLTGTRMGLGAAQLIPGVGPAAGAVDPEALAQQVDKMRRSLLSRGRSSRDVTLVLSPLQVLTPALVQDLTEVTSRRPVALFFDTYEYTSAFLDTWLLELFSGKHGGLPAELVVTVAGRYPVDPTRWDPVRGLVSNVLLSPFTESEARDYLRTVGVDREEVVQVILALSGCLPLLVGMLSENAPQDAAEVGDGSGTAVERFLSWETDPPGRPWPWRPLCPAVSIRTP